MNLLRSPKPKPLLRTALSRCAGVAFLLTGGLLATAEPPTLPEIPEIPELSAYRSVGSFDLFLQTHTLQPLTHRTGLRHSWTNLLVLSTLQAEGRFALEYFVGEEGQCYSQRNRGLGWNSAQVTNMTPAQLSGVRKALRELPATYATPPMERLVLLSFQDGNRWVTRSFDFNDRPDAFRPCSRSSVNAATNPSAHPRVPKTEIGRPADLSPKPDGCPLSSGDGRFGKRPAPLPIETEEDPESPECRKPDRG